MLPRHIIEPMAAEANAAVERALLHGAPIMHAPARTEVGLVAAVVLGAVDDIAKAWTGLCSGHGFSATVIGVICHASPQVAFRNASGKQKRCELADLLIVVDLVSGGGLLRRATLTQAKMAHAAGRVSLSGPSSATQLDLYQNWYLFDFVEAAYGLAGIDFKNDSAAWDSRTFGVIDRHFKSKPGKPPLWTQHAAIPTPSNTLHVPPLGTFMAEMVAGSRSGFGRPASPSLNTDWSKTVERLLQITYRRSFGHKPTLGARRAPRGVSAVACVGFQIRPETMLISWGRADGQPPVIHMRDEIEGGPAGISLLHIEIAESEPSSQDAR